jgi:predicted Zn finger-like uncharacterized protein
MFTVCPKCALTLVVTAADLRVAQGYVRCGRCSSVFNALARLTDERQPSAAAGESEQTPSAPAEPFPAPQSAESPAPAPAPLPADASLSSHAAADADAIPAEALEFNPATTDVGAVFVEPPPNPEWTAATGSFKAMIAATQEPARPEPPASGRGTPLDSPFLASMLREEAVAPAPAPARPTAHVQATPRAPEQPQEARGDLALDDAAREAEARASEGALARLAPHLWRAAAGFAALVLLAQVIDHYRNELAATARFNRPLTALYAALGLPLAPRWDVHAYDVRQLGASVDPAGAGLITVRASIRNAAQQPQPLPLLRVTLQDRFGNRIASSDVAPRFYLPHAVPASSFLSGGQRIDAEMGFVDPGANAVGFEIDACLPARGGGVACANDAGMR